MWDTYENKHNHFINYFDKQVIFQSMILNGLFVNYIWTKAHHFFHMLTPPVWQNVFRSSLSVNFHNRRVF